MTIEGLAVLAVLILSFIAGQLFFADRNAQRRHEELTSQLDDLATMLGDLLDPRHWRR